MLQSMERLSAYDILEIIQPDEQASLSIEDVWGLLNALHVLYHGQENIPIILSQQFPSREEVTEYLLGSGLARRKHISQNHDVRPSPELFLLRETFWQGGGTAGYHKRGWLRDSRSLSGHAPFPYVPSFTRTPLVITAHPLRQPKPRPGELLYKRYCPSVKGFLEFTYVDLEEDRLGSEGVGRHLEAFHRWHNSERVNKGWGEAGPIEKHRRYLKDLMADPGVIPMMTSWDGELMGYLEITWTKEDHIAAHIPDGARNYDRGFHILIGEDNFRRVENQGRERSRVFFTSILHCLFLADPRAERVIGEPKASNAAIVKISVDNGMHVETVFDFPYKRSAMTWITRDRFFQSDHLGSDRLPN